MKWMFVAAALLATAISVGAMAQSPGMPPQFSCHLFTTSGNGVWRARQPLMVNDAQGRPTKLSPITPFDTGSVIGGIPLGQILEASCR